jgi:hypothetical protein
MRRFVKLSMLLLFVSSFAFGQKVALVTFYVDKYINYDKATADTRSSYQDRTLADDPDFDLRPLLEEFYNTFRKEYVKDFPFELVDEKVVIGSDKYKAYSGLEGLEDTDSVDFYTENINDRFIAIDGYNVLLSGGNLLRSWRTEAHLLEMFPDVDGVMFVYMHYQFEPKVNIGGMGNAGMRAFINIDLFNKEAKKVFKMEEFATSKKSVPLINGVPIMTTEKILPLCASATERLLDDLEKELPKLVKKVDKNL